MRCPVARAEREWDLMVAGRPSCDLSFWGLRTWPEVGRDVDASGFAISAGESFNTPAVANRLGLRVAYVSVIGSDPLGALVLEEFEREGLPRDFLTVLEDPLPYVSVGVNLSGDRGFLTYDAGDPTDVGASLHRRRCNLVATGATRHVHSYITGDLELLSEVAGATATTVSLDATGGRWSGLDGPLASAIGRADILFANEPEAMAIAGADDLDTALGRLSESCPLVVVKRGGLGAVAVVEGARVESPTEPLAVVDATGAGDAFNAGFLYGWLHGLDVRDSLVLANICGGRATLAAGGYRSAPTEVELLQAAADRGLDLAGS